LGVRRGRARTHFDAIEQFYPLLLGVAQGFGHILGLFFTIVQLRCTFRQTADCIAQGFPGLRH